VVDGSRNTTGILYGKGDGTFQPGIALLAGFPLAVADFNGDGKADLLTASIDSSRTLTILLGVAPGNGPGPAASIAATGGTPQFAPVGTAFPSALQVTVKDAKGIPVAGAMVTFTAPSAGSSAILSAVTALTNSLGVASVTATANNVAGTYVVTASVGALSTPISLTNLSGTVSNLALGKAATQSSTLAGYPPDAAQSAVDGNIDGAFYDGSVTATNLEANPWWQVDLGASTPIGSIIIWNRTDCCGSRLSDYWVFVSDTPFLPTDTPATLQNRTGTFASHLTAAPNPSSVIPVGRAGRYVRVQLSGADYLSLAEVQVFSLAAPASGNLSQGKAAAQSSTLPGTPGAAAAVDGNTDGNFYHSSVTATNLDTHAWWQVDLGASATMTSIVIWNRTDCCAFRLSDYWVLVSDTPFLPTDTPATLQNRAGTFAKHQTSAPNPSVSIPTTIHPCPPEALCPDFLVQGRYVRIQLTNADYLSLAEVQVFGTIAITPQKVATQSSTLSGTPPASVAIDGSTDGNFYNGSVTATSLDNNAWWQVDLGVSTAISSIAVWNRTDCCASRLTDYWVFVSDTPFLTTDTPATLQNRARTFASHQATAPDPATTIAATIQGRYVRVQLSGTGYLSLAEVQVFGQ
jgi:hypothetical protein